MKNRKSLILHFDSLDVIDELSNLQIAQLFKAIRDYNLWKDVKLDWLMKAVFIPFKNQFDRDLEKYNSICERNRNNGKKWWRPKETEENPVGYLETEENQKEPKKAYSKNDSNNDNNNKKDNNNNYIISKETTLQEYIKKEFDNDFLSEVYNKFNLDKEIFKEECEAFLNYWIEKSPSWKKEKWQKEKTFDPKLRFRQWMKNANRWNKPNLSFNNKIWVVE